MTVEEIARLEVKTGLQAVYPRLWRYCLVLTGNRDDAFDLVQAACVHALEKSHLYQPGTHLDRWLFRMTQRLWFNSRRKEAMRLRGGLVVFEESEIIDERPSPEMNILAREVLAGVMALPEAQRLAVLLVYVEEYSYKEAAEFLDVPIGTIMSRLSAARSKLSGTAKQERKLG